MRIYCRKHPKYGAKRKPSGNCAACWDLYRIVRSLNGPTKQDDWDRRWDSMMLTPSDDIDSYTDKSSNRRGLKIV